MMHRRFYFNRFGSTGSDVVTMRPELKVIHQSRVWLITMPDDSHLPPDWQADAEDQLSVGTLKKLCCITAAGTVSTVVFLALPSSRPVSGSNWAAGCSSAGCGSAAFTVNSQPERWAPPNNDGCHRPQDSCVCGPRVTEWFSVFGPHQDRK